MTINMIVPGNLVLELAMLGIQSYAFHYSRYRIHDDIDLAYLSVLPVFVVFSFGWLLFLRGANKKVSKFVRFLRIVQGLALLSIGVLMIESERRIARSSRCYNFEQKYFQVCQLSVSKIIAGALALLDGLLYFFSPAKPVRPEEERPLLKGPIDEIPIAVAVEEPTEFYGPRSTSPPVGPIYPPLTNMNPGIPTQNYQQPMVNPGIISQNYQQPMIYPGGIPQNYQQPMPNPGQIFQQPANIPGANYPNSDSIGFNFQQQTSNAGGPAYYDNPPPYFETVPAQMHTDPSAPIATGFQPSGQTNYGAADQAYPTKH